MLLTPIRTCENTGPRLCEISVVIGVDILHSFINEVEIDLMPGSKSRACKAVDGLSTGV